MTTHWIDGRPWAGTAERRGDVYDPATGSIASTVDFASVDVVDEAVAAASRAWQSWREVWTDGRTRRVVLSDPHSPTAFRVNGAVRNDDGWYQAFASIEPGEAFYLPPEQRVRLW